MARTNLAFSIQPIPSRSNFKDGRTHGDMDIYRILQNIQGEMRLFPNRVFLRDLCRSQTWDFHRT